MCRQHQRTGVGARWQRRRQPGSIVGRHPWADGYVVPRGLATALREAATLQVDAPHARNVWLLYLCLYLYSLIYGPLALINLLLIIFLKVIYCTWSCWVRIHASVLFFKCIRCWNLCCFFGVGHGSWFCCDCNNLERHSTFLVCVHACLRSGFFCFCCGSMS